jgi:hypothetical protein
MPAVRRAAVLAAAVAIAAIGVAVPAPLAAAVVGVDPSTVELTLAPGASSSFAANVTTPVVAPNPDIVFLADTTGSMDPALANVRNNLRSIMTEVRAAQPTARFGVAEYKELRDGARVFRVDSPLTDDENAVIDGAQQWLYNVGGGGQPQTDFINAHFQLASGAVAFRPQSTRVVAWFGDARSNDPSVDHTLGDTVASLRATGIRVVAVPVTGTTGPGLDERGQATTITNETAGVLMPSQGASQVAAAILDGIQALSVPVTAVPACDPALTLTTDPTTRTVRSGTAASFTETVTVRPGTVAGTYRCTVDFQVSGMSVGYTQTVTVHVSGTEPVLRISDVTVDEGDGDTTTPATLTVSLDRAATQQVTVGWATVAGSEDDDFVPGLGTVTLAPGETSEQLTVGVVGDQVDEPDETFTVRLANAAGATIGDADGVVTIRDDDEPGGPQPLLRISDTSVPEADVDTTGSLTVSLDRAATEPVTVDWTTVPDSADAYDFVADSDTVTFAPGDTSEPLPVTVRGDDTVEQNEVFRVRLSDPTGAAIDDADGVVTIIDEDGTSTGGKPKVRIGDATGPEGNVGTTPATLTVALDRPSATALAVQWTTVADSANADDFEAASGELVFAPNEVSKQLTVRMRADLVPEGRESFFVKLSGAVFADDTAFVTIQDDDTGTPPGQPPALRIGDVRVPEGNATSSPATVTVVLDQAATVPVTVRWATKDGSATAPGDYTAASGVLRFEPGDVSQQVTVPVVGDQSFEQTETFGIELSEPVGATIADGAATVSVGNDDEQDGRPELTIDDASVVERSGRVELTVRLSAGRSEPVTVRLATRAGSATDPADYAGVDEVVTFEPGETLVSVPVAIVDDAADEYDETFTAELSGAEGAPVDDESAVVTVLDDDGSGNQPVVCLDDTSVAENDGPAVFRVRLTKAAESEVTVRWRTATDTAGTDDFTSGDGQVTFAPGDREARIEVPVTDDERAEGDEEFTVSLTEATGANLGDTEAVGTILDDDDQVVRPSVSVGDTSVRENAGPAGFELRLSEAARTEVTVAWTTGDGTALSPADYAAVSGTAVFTPGQLTTLVPVPVADDAAYEGDETFTLTLSTPSGTTIGDGTAVGTIVDDETATPGAFTCTASAAELLGARPVVANPGGTPCVDDTRTAVKARVGLVLLTVRVDGLTAATDTAPGGVSATAGLLTTRISTVGLVIEIGAITSSATATCVAGPAGLAPSFSGSSSIAWLKVNGVTMPIGSGPVKIPLLVGTLSLNSTTTTPDGLTQRAFDLRTLLGNVVIGESSVGATGNPCLSSGVGVAG